MFNISSSLVKIEKNQFDEVTLDDCLVYVQVFSYTAAEKIKELIMRLPKRCNQCSSKITNNTSNEILVNSRTERVCKDCYFEHCYGDMYGI